MKITMPLHSNLAFRNLQFNTMAQISMMISFDQKNWGNQNYRIHFWPTRLSWPNVVKLRLHWLGWIALTIDENYQLEIISTNCVDLYCNITATLIVHSTVKTHNRKKKLPLGYSLPFLIKMLWAFTTSLDEKNCQLKGTIHNSHSIKFRVQSAYLLLL